MNILFLSLLDFSTVNEQGIYTDLLREFIKNGHNINVISPTEKRNNRATQLIETNKTRILKIEIGNIQKTNLFEKGISTLTLESKFISGIKRYFSDIKFDLVIYSTPPITLQKVVEFVKKRDGAKSYLLLKDIFPQNAVDLGMFRKTNPIYWYFRHKEKSLYRNSDFIGCMSQANVDYILKFNHEINSGVVEINPNSIEPIDFNLSKIEKENLKKKYKIPIDKTVFVYGGNLGKPQAIDFLIECIRSNEKNDEVYFLVVGTGTEYKKIKTYFEQAKPKNSKLLSHLPKNDFEKIVNSCDVGLIYLDKRFTIPNFPSRLLSYMQASIPVLAATDIYTDIGKVIKDGNFGYWCESGNIKEFNQLVKTMCDIEVRNKMGENAREYLEKNYSVKESYKIIMNHFKN